VPGSAGGTTSATKRPNAGRTDAWMGVFTLSPLAARVTDRVLCARMWLLCARSVLSECGGSGWVVGIRWTEVRLWDGVLVGTAKVWALGTCCDCGVRGNPAGRR
jgi:hypothetical protein